MGRGVGVTLEVGVGAGVGATVADGVGLAVGVGEGVGVGAELGSPFTVISSAEADTPDGLTPTTRTRT